MVHSLTEQAIALPLEERLALISRLCESVEQAPVLTEAQRAFVRERLEEHRQAPDDVVPWNEARARLRKRFK